MNKQESLKIIRNYIIKYLNNKKYKQILQWCKTPNVPYIIKNNKIVIKNKNKYNKIEKKWGNKMNGTYNKCMWSHKLGENIVKTFFERNNIKIWKPEKKNNYQPDFETNKYIIEVKTRNWTTTGTCGEKVLGVPYKYSDIPKLYNKKLKIVCVAYQEYELEHGNFKIFSKKLSDEKKKILKLWKNMGIEFVQFTSWINNGIT